ncbi:bifunctional proline dehydrogenase/L-glutamate gamma-semialdehyde dehydrogenase [Corynebacterium aquilae]|uniref:L-glutamate gamma-semialdehyde dehydrogenase n=1 Tax=Corynebacterium aquilae DSM 44791 TaxID=1431546 RepID=A0A1L7CID1_9CORY|nr:bifunctional proline dehydrogenase/L-glutamate gamma-semialdehyde dehydrogenase [Corynebacterium aquilae]APT85565.1 aldehyde dehydrogenase [Corynebacterium aquilae DSM 44791]
MSSTRNPAAHTPLANSADLDQAVDRAVQLAHTWIDATGKQASKKEAASTEQLAAMVRNADGVAFTMDFVDRVARPEDNKVAARELANLASPLGGRANVPDEIMSTLDYLLLSSGAVVAPWVPGIAMPLARKRLRQLVGHLVLDAEGKQLNALLDRSADEGFRLNVNLLGEAVLGEAEATSRLERTVKLLQNPRVTYVSVKASSVCAQLNPWDIEGNTERLKERLRPLYRQAVSRSPHPFINLDMEEYKDLGLTVKLFKELLSEEEFLNLEAGIVLQAYLPDTFDALQELLEFAHERVKAGGAPVKVRLVKGANLSMEKVEAELHDWEQAPYFTKDDVDANYLRLMDYVLQPENADVLRVGVASQNMFTVAIAHELAKARGVERQLDIEMLQGMAPAQARAVRDVVGDLILYTPVVHSEEFDVAVSYLVRRLEENGASQNFLYALFAPEVAAADGLTPLQDQERVFRNAVANRWETFAGPNRTQDRRDEQGCSSGSVPGHFVGEPDTDPALPQNRQWAIEALAADPGAVQSPRVTDVAAVDEAVARAVAAGEQFGKKTGAERATLLDQAAEALARGRGQLITVMTHEAGKTVGEADPEVSEAIDFARYYAESARKLDNTPGMRFLSPRVVVVTPPWNFPVAIPMGGVFAALAAGASVVIKPAPQVVRCAEVAISLLREAGIGEDLVCLLNADEGEAGKRLVSHPDVDHVILTGASDTARLFTSFKPDMRLSAETSGKNAIIVTPSADPDLAVADVYKSAFGHAGQKCSAASLVILVGSMGQSKRFIGQLKDAVTSLHVGPGTDISTTMNGLIEAPGEKLKRGLTQLEPGETWLVQPKQLDAEGRLWSPGVRDGVKPGSWFHTNECFGPVLGIMRADTLEEAIEIQNTTGYGLTGGLHSLDEDEIAYWKEHVEVGNAYINRGITGAIVQRQSFGGWKDSAVGAGAKAGGPNYVPHLGRWEEVDSALLPQATITLKVAQALKELTATAGLSEQDVVWLRHAASSDAHAWATEFGVEHDPTGLVCESNVFRYRPMLEPLQVRLGRGFNMRDAIRLHLGSLLTGTRLEFTSAEETNVPGIAVNTLSDEAFAARIGARNNARVRVLGEVPAGLYDAAAKSLACILAGPALADGRRELLHQLQEQAVSHTRHRFGVVRGV